MNGKEKCKALKEIRRKIAENNDIYYAVEECQHKGDCKGTCPKCEAELRYLERELERRAALGKAVAFAGISLGVVSTFAACTGVGINPVNHIDGGMSGPVDYAGDIQPVEPEYIIDGDVSIDMIIPEEGNDGTCTDPDSDGAENKDGTEIPEGDQKNEGTESSVGTENTEGQEDPEEKENTDRTEDPDGEENPEGKESDGTETDGNSDNADGSKESADKPVPTLTKPVRNFCY
ncbi:MAG: hypothetical protein K5776_11770 [Lachnospiraceae bacterium]|nr:hypothetical protein [Lachnospiraceae bacterium]